ncbi:probable insulin-like peptide 2 [Drosophila innubila]|uniref:probable insulin-like peptide 2 n=1 Tax=Drosophila innubila TaxID=198719 RepID=UPI00148D4230|nr:probable insulin-like peptide 2 [Drosophila innubila]
MFKTISFSLAFLVVLCVLATIGSANESRQRLCSARLNDMLARLCTNGYNGKMDKKRSNTLMDLDPLDPIQYIEQKESEDSSDLDLPLTNARFRNMFQQERALSSLTATRRRTRERIVDECCNRSCRISELQAYCAA